MLLIRGVVKGVKQIERVNRKTGEVVTRHFVGIAYDKENGYMDEEVITDVQVSQKQLQSGIAAYYENLRGKEVYAPVFPMAWAGRNGQAGISWFFAGDGRAKPAERPAEKQAQVGGTKA